MEKLQKFKEPVLWIGGIILFFWIASSFENSYNKGKDDEIDKKVTAICNVILRRQPYNTNLYDECWTVGMEQFSRDN